MNTFVVVSFLATFIIGGLVGGGVVHVMTTTQVNCTTPLATSVPDKGISKLLDSKPIPLTGYRSY